MSKVIRILGNEDGFDFGNICSFITESYIGLWDYNEGCYFLVSKEDIKFCPIHLSESISSLDELDDAVYDKCDEHIEEVFDHCNYKIQLLDE